MDVSTLPATTHLVPLRYKKSRSILATECHQILANKRGIFGKGARATKNPVSLSSFLEEFLPCSCVTHLLFLASMFHLLYEEGLEDLNHRHLVKKYTKQDAFCEQFLMWNFRMAGR